MIVTIVIVRALGVSLGILDLMLTGLGYLLFSVIGTLAALYMKSVGEEVDMGQKLIQVLAGTSSSPNQVSLGLHLASVTLECKRVSKGSTR